MLCDICKEHIATIHYTEVLPNSKPKTMALCESCAKKKNLVAAAQFSVADVLKGLTEAAYAVEESGKTCPRCRLTFGKFRKKGRLGCAMCYEAFEPNLQPILDEIQRDKQHVGKVPKSIAGQPGKAAQLAQLHQKLKEVIDNEEFEEAAVLRDQIQAVKDEMEGGKPGK